MKKRLICALTILGLIGGGFVMNSCGETSEDVEKDPGEVVVESIAVTTPPTKTTYYEGESFEKDGMVVEATMSDGSKQKIGNARVRVTPNGALSNDDEFVTLTYQEKTTTVQITVLPLDVTTLKISKLPFSTVYSVGGTYDFNGLEATVSLSSGDITATADELNLTINGKAVKTGDDIDLEARETPYTVVATYRSNTTISDLFEISIIDGYKIEAENLIYTEPSNDLNTYVRGKNSEEGGYLTAANGNGAGIRPITDDSATFASGGSYLGDLKNGNVIEFYFKSEVASSAIISISASSGYMTRSYPEGSWNPSKMDDMQLNKAMSATANSKEIVIEDTVMLPGGEASDANTADARLWTNWQTVSFGTMDVNEGLNVVSIVVNSEYTNCLNSQCSFNLDYLVVNFK